MSNNVYIIKCNEYDDVKFKLPELIKMMGGIEKFVSKGEKIAIKVNLLNAVRPEAAVTTHPAIVTAVGKLIKNMNGDGLITDSPGSGINYNEKTLKKVYGESGMNDAAEESGCSLNTDCSYGEVSYPEGKLIKRFHVISPVIKADGVFNLCKMKTHMFMAMTGAVKNNLGVIPGLMKPGYHAKLHDAGQFADMLLDLAMYVSPRLTVMDAVIGMEGDGPSAGVPRKTGLLIASSNQLALDVVAGEIMGLKRENNPILVAAEKRGIRPSRIEDVNIIGINLDEVRQTYVLPENVGQGLGLGRMPSFITGFIRSFFKKGYSARPVINGNKCIACGSCIKSCPEKAITMNKQKKAAFIDDKKCIRCYCCHEMCLEKAIDLKHGIMFKLVNK